MIMVSKSRKASDYFSSESEHEQKVMNYKSLLCYLKNAETSSIIKTNGYVFLCVPLMDFRESGLLWHVLQKEKGLICCNRGFKRIKEVQWISYRCNF